MVRGSKCLPPGRVAPRLNDFTLESTSHLNIVLAIRLLSKMLFVYFITLDMLCIADEKKTVGIAVR